MDAGLTGAGPGRAPRTGLRAEGLTFDYGELRVLARIHLVVGPGSRTALLGANGSGKTTLLRCLSGAIRPSAGRVAVGERALRYDRAGLRAHRGLVQLVLQEPDDQLFSADVRRDVSFGPLNQGLDAVEVEARVAQALDALGIADLAARPLHHLSHGQRKRVAIAGAVAMRPGVLLLDEPMAGLDPMGQRELVAALAGLEELGTTVALATHDVDFALAWADRVAVVLDGHAVAGDPAALLGDRELLTRARLRMPWVLDLAQRLGVTSSGAGVEAAARPALRDLDSLAEVIRARLGVPGGPGPAGRSGGPGPAGRSGGQPPGGSSRTRSGDIS